MPPSGARARSLYNGGDMAELNIECRDLSPRNAGRTILEAYNAARAGSVLTASLASFDAGLRMWLIEAGAKHRFRRTAAGDWDVSIRRGRSAAQGTVPGLHHVAVADSGTVWACERARRLVKIDGATGTVIQAAEVAAKASHLAIDRTEKWVYVADPGADALLAVDCEELAVRHAWPAPGGPQLPLVTEDGIACVTGGATGTLTIVRPRAHGHEVQTVEVGACPHDPIAMPGGRLAFVPCAGDGVVVAVDLEDGRILGRHSAGDGPSHLALHPDGTRLYSANTFDGSLSCLSIEGDRLAQVPSGAWAHQPAVSADGRFVYVANFYDDTVSVFDAERMEKIASLETDPYPHGLCVSADGRWLVATGFSSECLRIYDATAHTQAARVEVGLGSSHIAFLPDRDTAYVACSVDDHLARISLGSAACTDRIRLP